MQNLVYPSAEAASSAGQARFMLVACTRCGLAFNATFDPNALVYDERYDNRVPSHVFREYYAGLARRLQERYGANGGTVVEIGCGKGEFLAALADEWGEGRLLGIDPGCAPAVAGGQKRANMTFIAGVFKAEYLHSQPCLVICRHTLEHIRDPVAFLREIRAPLPKDVPLYLEVPDLRWILDHEAFWDFCYEHCNYFTAESLAAVAELAGFNVTATGVGFGAQYLWLEAVAGDPRRGRETPSPVPEMLRQYAENEQRRIVEVKETLAAETGRGVAICVWGMATKGVVFSFLVDPERALIRHCIDVNSHKQGKFAPGSAHLIESPEILRDLPGEILVLVMNPNYSEEIRSKCRAMGVAARFADAYCRPLRA